MENDIKKAILKFEDKNNIKIDNYYAKECPKDRLALKDNYIGKDILVKRINEWLEICSNDAERKCLLELLEEYLYFPQNKFNEEIQRLTDNLQSQGIELKETLFVTFPSKRGVASGGNHVSAALVLATMGECGKENIITDVERATDDLRARIAEYKYIVFLDDIIGSGMTLNSNIENFLGRFSFKDEVIFFVAFLCGREKKVREKVKQFENRYKKEFNSIILHPLKKCLSETERTNKEEKIKNISKIEKEIEKFAIADRNKTYYMGFQQNQLLVSFYYNTPNNTLSLFWRPTSISVPLFMRTSYIRPTIDECRRNKQKLARNAYERGTMKK